ncbi:MULTISPECIES: DMT family transporter [unclassified Pseudovibrio]|uniref:DMT family transporter n=1 Tax=unclassified Pseudovibrio TaxID=2627060 RepID=UPI0007AE4082|nr:MULTISPECIES: DMT family transporter [unclassified Pseudovibrio]KZL01263.1 EamA-like transporter family protein [Pseudovibrio sp. W74]KZL11328.1 EamA-like transporter family protein [Pseudovibrio sp. Ad14]
MDRQATYTETGKHNNPTGYIILIGAIVGVNYALAKLVTKAGVTALSATFAQLLLAGLFLYLLLHLKHESLSLKRRHIKYYIINGFLGITVPSLVAYLVLQHIPAWLLTVLVTLSPLITAVLSSIVDGKLIATQRLVGILVGLAGISFVTLSSAQVSQFDPIWILIGTGMPLSLAIANIYRNKAYPQDASSVGTATGTMFSQVLLLLPLLLLGDSLPALVEPIQDIWWIILGIGLLSAASYALTFFIQDRTDSVGFSQVGYFATVSGILVAALVFSEPISMAIFAAIAVLFFGLALTNGHIQLTKLRAP